MWLYIYLVVTHLKYWKLPEPNSQVSPPCSESIRGHVLLGNGLFTVIDACPKLTTLNLTRCRGVSVADRRRFFEVRRDQSRVEAYP
jgi:hypothetical protein